MSRNFQARSFSSEVPQAETSLHQATSVAQQPTSELDQPPRRQAEWILQPLAERRPRSIA